MRSIRSPHQGSPEPEACFKAIKLENGESKVAGHPDGDRALPYAGQPGQHEERRWSLPSRWTLRHAGECRNAIRLAPRWREGAPRL